MVFVGCGGVGWLVGSLYYSMQFVGEWVGW